MESKKVEREDGERLKGKRKVKKLGKESISTPWMRTWAEWKSGQT